MAYTVKICCIGDSLTEGDNNGCAYRYELFRMLFEEGADFAMVGHRRTGDARLPERYAYHSAYCGYVIGDDELQPYYSLRRGIVQDGGDEAIKQADIVLLFAGANDVYQKIDLEHIGDRFEQLLNTIYRLNPSVTVYAGLHYERFDHPADSPWWLLSNYLESIDTAAYKERTGHDLRIVSLGSGCNRLMHAMGDYPLDNGHPNLRGNRKLASTWLHAILSQVREMNARPGEAMPFTHVTGLDSDLPETLTLQPCQGCTLHATVIPSDATVPTVQWYSTYPDVATVDEYGVVRAIRPGTTRISAVTLDGRYSATTTLCVKGIPFTLSTGMKLLHEYDFSNTDDWTGDTDGVVFPELHQFYADWRHRSGTLCSNPIAADYDRLLLEFTHMTAINQQPEVLSPAINMQVALGDIAVRFAASDTVIQLVQADTVLAEHRQISHIAMHYAYSLVVEGNIATLYRENEPLLKATVRHPDKELTISITWNESGLPNRLFDIRLYGAN